MFWHRTNINSLTFMMDNLHKKVRCDVDILFHDECPSCFYCCCDKDIQLTFYIIFIHANLAILATARVFYWSPVR